MGATLNVVLYKGRRHKNGSYSVMLLHHENGIIRKQTICKCMPDDWDNAKRRIKGKAANAPYLNNLITEKYLESERQMIRYQIGEIDTFQFTDTLSSLTLDEAFKLELTRFKDEMKVGAHIRLESFCNQFEQFSKVKLSSINILWFERVASYLKGMGNIGSTAHGKIKKLRSIIARYSQKPLSPEIRRFRIQATKTPKQKLTEGELRAIESLHLAGNLAAARDLFLMQIYLRGIRIGDLLQAKCKSFSEGRFNYSASKTGKDSSVKMIPKAVEIFDRYDGDQTYLFPFFTWSANNKLSEFENERNKIKEKESATSTVNRLLKEIGKLAGLKKPLSSHIARHTFARMAIDKINNPMVTMDLLGHSSLAVHQGYLNDIRQDDVLDNATDKIFE